jgi:hypothetical protein
VDVESDASTQLIIYKHQKAFNGKTQKEVLAEQNMCVASQNPTAIHQVA